MAVDFTLEVLPRGAHCARDPTILRV